MSKHWIKTPSGKLRGRGLGLPLGGKPGVNNAITDVPGVSVGYSTIISGEGPLVRGQGPVRTGVTAIIPRPRKQMAIPCAAGYFSLNGNGEMSGLAWIEEAGELQTPITITNTHSCGITRDATIKWMIEREIISGQEWMLPVAAETCDSDLNDINGFHVTDAHTFVALDGAKSGAIEQGSVGGGTGMTCYDFKGGSGTASRLVNIADEEFTVGVFVQSNFGERKDLMVLGVPVGQHILEDQLRGKEQGSIIAIVATDAPLNGQQLNRLARRVAIGLARTGAYGGNGSGDIFLAFSTANVDGYSKAKGNREFSQLANASLNPVFRAVVEATEEAIIDSIVVNETMIGRDGNRSIALPHDRLLAVMRQYGRAIS
jgi:L-aminopeptidase/D-esterase-like protein